MMWPAALSSAFQGFDVAAQYFEEILLDLKKNKKERVDKAY